MRFYVFRTWLKGIDKIHDLVTEQFPSDRRFVIEGDPTFPKVKKRIDENRNSEDVGIIIYMAHPALPFVEKTLDYLRFPCNRNLKCKVILFTEDFWHIKDEHHRSGKWPFHRISNKIFHPNCHHTITFADSLEKLSYFHGEDLSPWASRLHFFNIWCCYNKSFVEFNSKPVPKIAVSGSTIVKFYPERNQMLNLGRDDIVCLPKKLSPDLEFTQRLNQYLCCFTSSVHVFCRTTDKLENANILLQKYFEILASGSLLLCPRTESKQLEAVGIIDNEHCIMVSMESDELENTITWILDSANRPQVDAIRLRGHTLAKEQLNSRKKYYETLKILGQIIHT